MTAATHTIGLLGAEVQAETNLLEQEQAEHETLKTELAHVEEMDEEQRQRFHPFAQDCSLNSVRALPTDYETCSTTKMPTATLFDLDHDSEAKDVLDQLRHHLGSMQSNTEGTNDIAAALSTSKAALDLFNWRNLGKAEYRQVYAV